MGYLTPEEVAAELRVSHQAVRRWLRGKQLKGVKVGNQWRIREEDLKQFLKEGGQD